MTVRELISELEHCDPDAEVRIDCESDSRVIDVECTCIEDLGEDVMLYGWFDE